MPHDAEVTLIKIGTAQAGPFVTVSDLNAHDWTHGREGVTRTRVYGKADAYVKGGAKTNTYTFSGLLDLTDTDGQNVLEDAYEDDDYVWAQLLHAPDAATGERTGILAQVKVTEYSGDGSADGEYVGVSFSLEGTGVTTKIVATA